MFSLHREVDCLKSVGLGPGITFASHYLDINQVITSMCFLMLIRKVTELAWFLSQLVQLQSSSGYQRLHLQWMHVKPFFLPHIMRT